MNFWLAAGLFFGCQTAGTQVGRAVMLEQQGDSVAAFDIYAEVLKAHPNTPEAKTALRRIQRMQLKTAKELESVDATRASAMYESIEVRWPNSEYAQLAAQKRASLEGRVPQSKSVAKTTGDQAIVQAIEEINEPSEAPAKSPAKSTPIVDEAELAACDTARNSNSRVVWQQYKQTFPTGACIEEAEAFLKVVAPRQMELDQAKVKAAEAHKSLTALCKEYRLVQTTSNERACENPSESLMREFARLQKRKADLLSSGERDKIEYYEKFVPTRWNTLSKAENKACQQLRDFVDELSSQGIDRKAIESDLLMVQTCFVEQGTL